MHLRAGEIVVFPHGDANTLASAPGMRGELDTAAYYRPADRQLPFSLKMNGESGADTCRFVCGFLGCDARPFNPLLAALPRVLHAPVSERSRGWLASLVDVAVRESGLDGAGRRGDARQARGADVRGGDAQPHRRACPRTRAAGSPPCATRRSARRSG